MKYVTYLWHGLLDLHARHLVQQNNEWKNEYIRQSNGILKAPGNETTNAKV
jgi:hypothetical protein